MLKNSKTQTIIAELCERLHCSELADDLERVNHARDMLARLQQNEIFGNLIPNKDSPPTPDNFKAQRKLSSLLFKTKQRLTFALHSASSSSDLESVHTVEENVPPEEEYEIDKSEQCNNFSDDAWLGYFRGYKILEEKQDFVIGENKQCIELSLKDESSSLENFLRAGIRCFMIDLFIGTELENQRLIFMLRECELKISREYGFPITTTLIAMLSPRLQFTGLVEATNSSVELDKDDELILTTKRKYSSIGSFGKAYVNARFLIEDCRQGDFILVGPSLQLAVTEVMDEELRCVVKEPGVLSSRLPVRFPGRCSRMQISLEELEDITFAREVGINVLVSYMPGSLQYLNDLYEALRLLKSDNLRIFTRLILNEYGEKDMNLDWIAQRYDGFLVDLSIKQNSSCCQNENKDNPIKSDILRLSPNSVNLLTQIYNMKKPILLKPTLIAEHQLFVQNQHIHHIFYYPDKYIFSSMNYSHAFTFQLLQNAMSEHIPKLNLTQQPFCDFSELGCDTLARACVAASFETESKAILVCSTLPDMSIILSHFRPKAPIIHLSATKSLGDYISLYHHIICMYFQTRDQNNYAEYVINAFIYGVIFLRTRNLLNAAENVILVYSTEADSILCDKYLVYKFDEQHFAKTFEEILFTRNVN